MARQIPWPTTATGWFAALLMGNLLAVASALALLDRPTPLRVLLAGPCLVLWALGLRQARVWFGRRR